MATNFYVAQKQKTKQKQMFILDPVHRILQMKLFTKHLLFRGRGHVRRADLDPAHVRGAGAGPSTTCSCGR